MNHKIRNSVFLSILSVVFWAGAAGAFCQEGEEVDTDKEAERYQIVADACVQELKESIRRTIAIKIDYVQRVLALDDSNVRKARVLAKGIAGRQARKFKEPFVERLQRIRTSMEGERFSVNKVVYSFAEDDGGKTADFTIKIIPQLDFSRASITIRNGNRSTGSSVSISDKLDFESAGLFSKALNSVPDEELNDAREKLAGHKMGLLCDGIAVLLADRLELTEDQLAKMTDWLETRIGESTDQQVYEQMKTKFKASLFEEVPEFLTDTQKVGWNFLKNSQYPLGW
jgi:hypothetical protein